MLKIRAIKKKLASALLLTVPIFIFVLWVNDAQKMDTFTLELHGMEDLGVKGVIVKGSDFTTAFYDIPKEWDAFDGLKINVSSLSKQGTVSLTINTSEHGALTIPEMPFKVGKTNYVSENQGELSYVKAHWN
jgi:hypothetical protein